MWRIAAAVAGVALLAGLLSPLVLERLKSPAAERYTTDVAQQTAEILADGSTVTLGGDSRLSVHFDERARRVVLERGEAFFDVAKDASRPFTVRVVDSEVRAVGTAFNINKRDQAVTVSVVEGVVDVTRSSGPTARTTGAVQKARLQRGQELVYDRSGHIWATRDQVALEQVVAWRNGRLAFVNERLDRVLQDINRYSKRRLVLGDNSLAGLRFTGTVFSTDIQGWLEGLEQAFNVRSLNVDDSIVLLKQTDTGG
jgi:transmembrane sensor